MVFCYSLKNNLYRVGRISTSHGVINTPSFVPVGTHGVIKSCTSEQVDMISTDLLFCNTYHLMVHPGEAVIENAGGIHKFMNRKAPIITDSGGFQVFSLVYGSVESELKSKGRKKNLSSVNKISEEGVLFNSYYDGKKIFLTPESSINAQKKIGADIIIPLDELLPYHSERKKFISSFHRTHRWQIRSLEEHKKNKKGQLIYGIIHGGLDEEYRKKSCLIINSHDFDGYAIGGSLGKNSTDVASVIAMTLSYLDPQKPRHLLGIADLETIKIALKMGIDTFDSSYPTKCARHGVLFSDKGPIKITQSRWSDCHEPISSAPICNNYTLSYLHHLFKMHELTAATLASINNIWYLQDFCNKIKN